MAESKVFKMERAYNPASKRAAKEIREVSGTFDGRTVRARPPLEAYLRPAGA